MEGEDSDWQSLEQVPLAELARAHAAATVPSSSSGGADSAPELLARETEARVAGASWSLGTGTAGLTSGGLAAAGLVKSARALALASRTSRQHLVLMKRITLFNPLIYFLIMGRHQLAAAIHGDRLTLLRDGAGASRFLYWCYASSTAVLLFTVTMAVGWFVTQTDATKRRAPRTRLLFWLVLADCALGAHNATAMAEYVQKPGNECGGLNDVGRCLLDRYWASTHLAFTLKWVATGYTVDVLFFPELFRSLLFVAGVCGVVSHSQGRLAPGFIAALFLRAFLSFCVTLTAVAVTGHGWATLERAGLDRDELLSATCPSFLWGVRDATAALFNAAGRRIRRTLLFDDAQFAFGRPTLPVAHLAVVICIVLGRFTLHEIGRMQLSLFLILQAIELVGHGRMTSAGGGALDKQHDGAHAIPGCDSPELKWEDVGVTGRVLGMGAHGSVYEARLKGTVVALKVWQDDAIAVSSSEVAILMSLRHPNVLSVWGVLRDPPALVTEKGLCSLQALLADPARSAELTWRVRLSIMRGICAGCDFLHAHNPPIIHGDLKTSNIIMAPGGVPKLADFGSSFVAHRFTPRPLTGFSRAFAAPEVLHFLPVNLPTAVDVYSFGIVVLNVARVAGGTGSAGDSLTFFDNADSTATWAPVTVPPDLPRPLQAVVRECLAAQPEQRCTFRSLVATLSELDKKLTHG